MYVTHTAVPCAISLGGCKEREQASYDFIAQGMG